MLGRLFKQLTEMFRITSFKVVGILSALTAFATFFSRKFDLGRINWLMLSIVPLYFVYLIVRADLKQERNRTSNVRWRIGLYSIFSCTALIALSLSFLLHDSRNPLTHRISNEKIKISIERIIRQGQVRLTGNSRKFSIKVSRRGFNDDDLMKIVSLTSVNTNGNLIPHIAELSIDATSVTDEGLRLLSNCVLMERLAISTGPMSEETQQKLIILPSLKVLEVDCSKLTSEQFDDLANVFYLAHSHSIGVKSIEQ